MNILAIDQGTSATKALVVGPGGEVLGSGGVPVHPRSVPGHGVEQDPEELYASVIGAGSAALAAARAPADAIALANQGETVLAWDRRTGRPAGRDHRPAPRPVFRRAEDDLGAREPERRWRGHHDRLLAAGPARRELPDRRQHGVPDAAARPGRGYVVGGGVCGVRAGS